MLSRLWRFIAGDSPPIQQEDPPPPKKRRPRRSKEEMVAVRAEQLAQRKVDFRESAAENRERMISAGIDRYRWSSSGDERVCEHCKANAGKTFLLSETPEHGHPGEVECCNDQACRCTMTPLIEGIDY